MGQEVEVDWLILLYIYSIAVPVATFMMAVLCGTDKLRCDLLLNMLLVSFGVVISSYGEIHFNVVGTVYQVTGIFAEALRLVLTQVLLQKKGLTLNPITSLYYIAPCRYSSSIHEIYALIAVFHSQICLNFVQITTLGNLFFSISNILSCYLIGINFIIL